MKITTNKLSDTKIELSFVLGKSELEDARLVSLKKMAGSVNIPGFRSGKAPANVVEKHVDPNALAESSLENAINKAVAKGFIDEKIQVLDRPQVEVLKYVPGETLEFKAIAETLPEVKLGDYKKLKLRATKASVSSKDVDEVLDKIRDDYSEKKPTERAAKNGDEAVIDFVGKKDGEAFDGGAGKEYSLKLGSNSFIPGFEDGIVGHKAGDKFDLKLTFPKDYFSEDLKGQEVVFEVVVHSVNEVVVPKLDMELVKKCGPFKSVEELKKDIKKNLEGQKNHEADEKLKDDLVKELVEISDVQAPDILILDQTQALKQDTVQNLMYRGMTLEAYLSEIKKTEDEWTEESLRPIAESRVKAGLVLAELSKELALTVSDEDVDAKLGELRDVYKKNEDAIKQLATDQVRNDVRNRLMTEKTVEKLVSFAK
jgi:trigger factor